MCRHCGQEPNNRPRGLGWRCYYTPAVRALYPPKGARGRDGARGHAAETDADLDALIEEQRRNLPKWWFDVKHRSRDDCDGNRG